MVREAWRVVELFGPTIQGEGPDAGTPCHFIRFGGCDYRCGYARRGPGATLARDPRLPFMCDSLHAVLPEHVREAELLRTPQILERLSELRGDPQYVVLSGGNPALHDLTPLVEALHEWQWRVSIETQGTLWKDWINDLDTVVISPKPPSAGQPFSMPILDNFMRQLSGRHREPRKVALKVPIYDEHDLRFADVLAERFDVPMYLSVVNAWIADKDNPPLETPQLRENLLRQYEWIVEHAQDYDNLTTAPVFPQMHVIVWGEEKNR